MDFYELSFRTGDDVMVVNKSYSNKINLLVASGQIGKFIDIVFNFKSDGLIIEKGNYNNIATELKEIVQNPIHKMNKYKASINKNCKNIKKKIIQIKFVPLIFFSKNEIIGFTFFKKENNICARINYVFKCIINSQLRENIKQSFIFLRLLDKYYLSFFQKRSSF